MTRFAWLHCGAVFCIFLASEIASSSESNWDEVTGLRKEIYTVRESDQTANLWPLPQRYSSKDDFLTLAEKFQFIISGSSCSILEAALSRYEKTIFDLDWSGFRSSFNGNNSDIALRQENTRISRLSSLYILIDPKNPCDDGNRPDADMDESYELFIRPGNVSSILSANSIWGVLRGLETFSQLIWQTKDGRLAVNQSTIFDKPRFSYRGLMLDTSRHFISKRILLQNLDIMAMNKFNVFHWHIVDDHSFPYQSTTFPNLTLLGAYEPRRHIYTQSDIAEIIEYARLRGIRVIPEFDTPGHTLSWGFGLLKLLTPCYFMGKINGQYGPVNPALNYTYETLKLFFAEIFKVFPDQYVHLGGDEVDFSCWKSNPDVVKFMEKLGFGGKFEELEEYYFQTLLGKLEEIPENPERKRKRGYVVWQEVFDNKVALPNNTIIHVWKDFDAQNWKNLPWQREVELVTKAGYQVILSSCWYLNYISYGSDWKTFYKCDPWKFTGSGEQYRLVIGGEGCMWGEYIDDTNLLVKLWPRASAVAERLWSSQSVNSILPAIYRLDYHRCLMNKRGYPAEPNVGPGFCPLEYGDSI